MVKANSKLKATDALIKSSLNNNRAENFDENIFISFFNIKFIK